MKYGERLTSDRSMLPVGGMCWVWVKMQARSPMQQSTENLICISSLLCGKQQLPLGRETARAQHLRRYEIGAEEKTGIERPLLTEVKAQGMLCHKPQTD